MRKTLSIILATVMLCLMLIPVTGCGPKADYASPHDAIVAADSGTNVIGKTVQVTASQDVTLGYFYTGTDIGLGVNVGVGVYKPNSAIPLDNRASGINKGQTLICTIKEYNDHLETSRILLVEVKE